MDFEGSKNIKAPWTLRTLLEELWLIEQVGVKDYTSKGARTEFYSITMHALFSTISFKHEMVNLSYFKHISDEIIYPFFMKQASLK